MAKTYNENAAIRGALRRVFARSPLVVEKVQESRREVPRYLKDGSRAKKDWVQRQCEVCSSWVGSTKISIDHKNPVVSVQDGFTDWNEFIARLWCSKENLQRICDSCHDQKTQVERISRLTLQYAKELDQLELDIKAKTVSKSEALKTLKKYIAKKKTSGLDPVVQRALKIKDLLTT
jgi:hypothetical protein